METRNTTQIVVVLDRSGSMGSIQEQTVEGFNSFLAEQKATPGEAFLTLVQFDHEIQKMYVSRPIQEVEPLVVGSTFVPRGSTALYDAVGMTIQEIDRNNDVVFVIITDGFENASREYKKEAIFKMIETCEKEYGWKFLFLGANQDAIAQGSSIGVQAHNSITYATSVSGTRSVYAAMSSNISSYRSSKTYSSSSDPIWTMGFTDDQRKEADSKE